MEQDKKTSSARVPASDRRTAEQPKDNMKWPSALRSPEGTPAARPAPELRPADVKRPVRKKKRRAGKPKEQLTRHEEVISKRDMERQYMPVRFRRDGRIGLLGGMMYAVFIICASIILACFGWMAASDVLALNKSDSSVEITLPETAFYEKEVEVKDDDGNVTGTKKVQAADIDQVASILHDSGVINYTWLFRLYSSFSNADLKLDPGTYELQTNLDYRAIVTKLQSGSGTALQVLVTLPEGFNMDQIFARLEENGVCSAEDLYDAAANAGFSYSFLEGMDAGEPERLEGFLYPDTYYFYQGMQASSAINKFLSNMYYKITDEMTARAEEMGMNMRQVLTVASLIEKEAANDEERATIASVIYNRLNAGMMLQFDSTVVYALRESGVTELTTDMLINTDSPYNTYINYGLPPTPICNPGMESIMAALYPAETNYLYFALDESTNSMRFFVTAEDQAAFAATQGYGEG